MFRSLQSYQIVIDVIIAVLFALVTAPAEIGVNTAQWWSVPIGLLAGVVFGAALALRRMAPGLALGIAWLGAIVEMTFGRVPGPASLAVFAVLYTAAAYGTITVFWFGFGSAIAGAIVAVLYLYIAPGNIELTMAGVSTVVAIVIAAIFAFLLAWTAGALVRATRRSRVDRVAQQRARAEAIAEQERTRIARDMHDVVAHSLAVVIAQADGARYAAASDPAAQSAALGTISSTARSALADVRLLLGQLRHSQEDGPQPTIADLDELFGQIRAAGLDIRVTVDPAPRGDVPAAVQLAVYRILQEALTNALRHGAPGPVDVGLAWHPARVDVIVRNALAAPAAPGAPGTGSHGHGLIGMRERALLVGGTLDAGAEAGAFVVRAGIPIGGA
ncbi:histidine kinase [Microbacterium horticulturae]|uniref:histidine kinase n=1 Tax=Microbacterium horticulturae TaxID=3028316 RepID=A0ABY8BYU9_9MICO|nr:histidine kinase [Microbacterium sp. KACC 23027]WEG09386.1 histidine kinase [Microbacterium sp. KACC 23027]